MTTDTTTTHTQGALRIGTISTTVVSDTNGPGVRGYDDASYGGFLVAESVHPENARRIAACWNILHDIPTEKLEAHSSIAELMSSEAYLTGMTPTESGVSIGLSGIGCQLLAASFAGQFKGSGAINFLEVWMEHEETGPMLITIQRTQGTTPAQQLAAVRAERDQLLAAAARLADRGWFDPNSCADTETLADMKAMREAIANTQAKNPEKSS